MRRSPRALVAALALASALVPPGRASAADEGCRFGGVPRVVAVGDVHGAYERFAAILRQAQVIDDKGRWSGGRAHLVQLGDVLDRGTDTRRSLELLMRLEREARRAGGRVHALLGNHEVMNMVGDLRYVKAPEYELFRTPQSEERRHHLYERSLAQARDDAKARGETLDERAFRARFFAQVPLGFIERTLELSAEGSYGRWLRERPATVVVDDVVFVHGGLTPESAALGCEGINAAVRREVTVDIEKTRSSPATTLSAAEDGPLWYRGLARDDETALAPALERTLQSVGARAIAIGHTVTPGGKIVTRFSGRVVMIDAGMTDEYGGHAAALEIDAAGGMTAVYPGAREPLTVPLPRAARAAPVRAPLPNPVQRPRLVESRPLLPQGGPR